MLGANWILVCRASVQQEVAFVGFAIFTIGFFIWLALLARRK